MFSVHGRGYVLSPSSSWSMGTYILLLFTLGLMLLMFEWTRSHTINNYSQIRNSHQTLVEIIRCWRDNREREIDHGSLQRETHLSDHRYEIMRNTIMIPSYVQSH